MLGKVEEKRRWPTARWMDSVTLGIGALLKGLKTQVKNRLPWRKIYVVAKS